MTSTLPKINSSSIPKSTGFNGWQRCNSCENLIHQTQLEKNLHCCPKCNNHYRMDANKRIELLCDPDSFIEKFTGYTSSDPLEFFDTESYKKRLEDATKKTGLEDAIITGTAKIGSHPVALGVMEFRFMAGSLNTVVGEKIVLLAEYALQMRIPLILVTASGGARMQESILSLMQMAKTSAAIGRLNQAGIPYISILTDPTCGGTTASFATLGDIIIAEPNALVCFAGPRVIEQTIKRKLPADAQRAEFLLSHGMIDAVVPRQEMRQFLSSLLLYTKCS